MPCICHTSHARAIADAALTCRFSHDSSCCLLICDMPPSLALAHQECDATLRHNTQHHTFNPTDPYPKCTLHFVPPHPIREPPPPHQDPPLRPSTSSCWPFRWQLGILRDNTPAPLSTTPPLGSVCPSSLSDLSQGQDIALTQRRLHPPTFDCVCAPLSVRSALMTMLHAPSPPPVLERPGLSPVARVVCALCCYLIFLKEGMWAR